MRCPKCGSKKVERIILPRLDKMEISKFIEPGSTPTKGSVFEKIKCAARGHSLKG